MDLLQNLITFLSYTQTNNVSLTSLNNSPFHAYCKDKKGVYLDSNDMQAQDAGLKKASEVIGRTDLDLAWVRDAPTIMKNDRDVILKRQPKLVVEVALIANTIKNEKLMALSYKIPLCTQRGKLIGVSGLSFVLRDNCFLSNKYLLSKRQKECHFYLVRGKSDKEIGKILGLCPRTVESYVNEIKFKMGCSSRSQIIEKSFNEGMLAIFTHR